MRGAARQQQLSRGGVVLLGQAPLTCFVLPETLVGVPGRWPDGAASVRMHMTLARPRWAWWRKRAADGRTPSSRAGSCVAAHMLRHGRTHSPTLAQLTRSSQRASCAHTVACSLLWLGAVAEVEAQRSQARGGTCLPARTSTCSAHTTQAQRSDRVGDIVDVTQCSGGERRWRRRPSAWERRPHVRCALQPLSCVKEKGCGSPQSTSALLPCSPLSPPTPPAGVRRI